MKEFVELTLLFIIMVKHFILCEVVDKDLCVI